MNGDTNQLHAALSWALQCGAMAIKPSATSGDVSGLYVDHSGKVYPVPAEHREAFAAS